jgi:2-polyprenyl-3-methyl-5-hydroxy-6-metoxy-1,4-benzoquinol methylase
MDLIKFGRIGTEQYWVKNSRQVKIFYRLLGAADIHTRVRTAHALRCIEACSLPPAAHILDAGCGEGMATFELARRFPDHAITGVDFDASQIDRARFVARHGGFKNVQFYQIDLQTWHKEQEFDAVLSVDVLEHIPDDEAVLRNLWRSLRVGAPLILHIPRHRHLQQRVLPGFTHHDVKDHVRPEYTESEITAKLIGSGFDIMQFDYTFGFLGEFAWEVNNIFWLPPIVRRGISLAMFPLSLILGYVDVKQGHTWGNSFLIKALKDTRGDLC